MAHFLVKCWFHLGNLPPSLNLTVRLINKQEKNTVDILIVDDDSINLKLLRVQLEDEGYVVFEAPNGVDALTLLERQRVDVLIADISMPEMDGYRLCYEIRKHTRLHDLPIILCTSTYASAEDKKLVQELRAVKYLKRPVSRETILAVVREVKAIVHAAPQPKAMQEIEVLTEYSERLVSKLEEKNTELQAKIEALYAEIAERKHAEERFQALFEFASDAFVMTDQQGIIRLVNRQAETMFGYPRDELYGQPVEVLMPEAFSRVHADLRQGFLEKARARAVGLVRADLLGLRKDGTTFPVDISLSPIELEGGIVVVAAVRDVTQRQLADLELASTNRALQMLSRCNEILTHMDDEAELLLQVCRLAVDLGGYRMAWVGYAQDDEALSIRPMALVGHEEGYLTTIKPTWNAEQPSGQGPAGKTIRSGQASVSEDMMQGANHWHQVAARHGYRSVVTLPLRDASRTFGILGLYSGVVAKVGANEIKLLQELADNLAFGIGNIRLRLERRQADAKVRELSSILDKAQDAIVIQDLQHKVIYWNQGAERLYRRTAVEALGQSVSDLMREPADFARAMDQLLAADEWVGELLQVDNEGLPLVIEGHWTLVRDDQGAPSHVLAINTDIRERKRAEEEVLSLNAELEERVLQRTAELEFANQQLEAFSYSVSHDLRSPLRSIDGFCNMLSKEIGASAVSDRGKHYFARIRGNVMQMGELIDALLSLAQVSRTSLSLESVDLSAMAETILNGYREREPDRAAQVAIQPGLLAQGDPRLLRQVLDNLLGNGWKFSGQQPQTHISFGCESSPDGEAKYVVRDKGAGFDMAYAEKLFGAFQRLHTVSEFAGTGIGLATVHRIITLHGGRIWAESAPGQGATFYFTLGGPPGSCQTFPVA